MKKLVIAVLFLSLTANADAQTWKQWWKHHHFLCLCVGNPVGPTGGN
jgi:hypothetical protein